MYDNPTTVTHVLDLSLTAAGNVTISVPPDAYDGIVRLAGYQVTTVVAADTTAPTIAVTNTGGGDGVTEVLTIADATAANTYGYLTLDSNLKVDPGENLLVQVSAGVDASTATGDVLLTLVVDWNIPQPQAVSQN